MWDTCECFMCQGLELCVLLNLHVSLWMILSGKRQNCEGTAWRSKRSNSHSPSLGVPNDLAFWVPLLLAPTEHQTLHQL